MGPAFAQTPAADIRGVLTRLLAIVRESDEYFVSGSLSFLPLLPHYRDPFHDVDVAVSARLFEAQRSEFAQAGRMHVLRLGEVAIADASSLARLLVARTRFVHIDTPDGLIDLTQYALTPDSLELFLGAGLTLRVPATIMDRVRVLEWQGLRYRAGPPELAIVPKILWYDAWKRSGTELAPGDEKHLLDLRHAAALVDWSFAESVLAGISLHWLGGRFPTFVDRALNPLRRLDLYRLRRDLEDLQEDTSSSV